MGESEVGGEAGAGGLDGISDTCSCCSAREFAPSKGLVLSLRGGGGGLPRAQLQEMSRMCQAVPQD